MRLILFGLIFQGDLVPVVGSTISPWVVKATVVNLNNPDDSVDIGGSNETVFIGGYAKFNNFSITNQGRYQITIEIIDPPEAALIFSPVT